MFSSQGEAALISVVSASGGTGKSTIALLAGLLSAQSGIETGLLEADLQYGDMGYWLDLDDELPSLATCPDCPPVYVSESLALYKAPPLPEMADEVAEAVAHYTVGIRRVHELVIADTGQFWSGLTAELLCASNLILVVFDWRPATVSGAIKAGELCQRLGIPSVRCHYVYNRCSPRGRVSFNEAHACLDTEFLYKVADGKGAVEALVSTGKMEELLSSGNAAVRDIDSMLAAVLPRIGRLYSSPLGIARKHLFA